MMVDRSLKDNASYSMFKYSPLRPKSHCAPRPIRHNLSHLSFFILLYPFLSFILRCSHSYFYVETVFIVLKVEFILCIRFILEFKIRCKNDWLENKLIWFQEGKRETISIVKIQVQQPLSESVREKYVYLSFKHILPSNFRETKNARTVKFDSWPPYV